MHLQAAVSVLAAVVAGVSAQAGNPVTGILGDAVPVKNNPAGAVYTATLPPTAFAKSAYPNGGNIKGSIFAVSSPDGAGVLFKVSFSGLPTVGGPFLYHIHDQPVPADGNCTNTLAHLDPYLRGEMPPCDGNNPQTCQVGDLSGKHGKVTSDPFDATYTDNFASTLSGIGDFIGNRSFVIHFANTTRISCANFQVVAPGSSSCSPTTSMSMPMVTPTMAKNVTATSATSKPTTTFVQAAANANAPAALFAMGIAAFAYLL